MMFFVRTNAHEPLARMTGRRRAVASENARAGSAPSAIRCASALFDSLLPRVEDSVDDFETSKLWELTAGSTPNLLVDYLICGKPSDKASL